MIEGFDYVSINGPAIAGMAKAKHDIRSIRLPYRLARGAVFNGAEKAALEWAEAVTDVAGNGAPEHLYNALLDHCSENETVDLTLIISQMIAWNRLAISFGHNPDASSGCVFSLSRADVQMMACNGGKVRSLSVRSAILAALCTNG